MSAIQGIGTYLPTWAARSSRGIGIDEDAVTLAVAAGLAGLTAVPGATVERVVFVTRQPPLLEGGNSAALLAGLGLAATTEVVERIGGAPAALEAVSEAAPGTLILAVDADTDGPAGAAAALVGGQGAQLSLRGRTVRSLPIRVRSLAGSVHDYDDPRLLRERGVQKSRQDLGVDEKAAAVAGVTGRDVASLATDAPALPTVGASAPLFALGALCDAGRSGLVLAVEDATVVVADFRVSEVAVCRDEPAAQPPPALRHNVGPEIAISLAAYARAFDAKVRLEAGRCTKCGTLAYPPRYRCIECGAEEPVESVALPRDAVVYTTTTINVPVPSMATPYSLAVVELGDTGVRVLVHVTDAPPGCVAIDDRGRVVLRRVAVRSGVPDYGYAFRPDRAP
ncbi:MAG TPA: OB-fold domain-containing protein [Acidimicrobiales bacterium]|nr:OB-fold domain-containing protein [Acidimicrobiales bacterium]